eukprot:308311_1
MSSIRREPRYTARYVENLNIRRRNQEAEAQALRRYNDQESVVVHSTTNEERAEVQRRVNRLSQIAAQEAKELEYQKMEERALANKREQALNEALVNHVTQKNAEHARKEAEIARICSQSEELKLLQEKLKIAYINKERATQQEQRRMLKAMEEDIDHALVEHIEHVRKKTLREETQNEAERQKVGEVQRELLQKQIEERRARLDKTAEVEADRRMLASIAAHEEMEELHAQANRREKREEMQRMTQKDTDSRVLERKRLEDKREDEFIESHRTMVSERLEKEAREKAERKARAEANFRIVATQTENTRVNDEELHYLQSLLWEEELEEKKRREDIARQKETDNAKAEMVAAQQQQLRWRTAIQEKQRAEEESLVAEMHRKFIDDEAKESEKKKRTIAAKYKLRAELEAQREDQFRQLQEEDIRAQERLEQEKQKEEYREQVVKEARRRLLEQHAHALDGFLPKGTFAHQDEIHLVQNRGGESTESI